VENRVVRVAVTRLSAIVDRTPVFGQGGTGGAQNRFFGVAAAIGGITRQGKKDLRCDGIGRNMIGGGARFYSRTGTARGNGGGDAPADERARNGASVGRRQQGFEVGHAVQGETRVSAKIT